MYQKISGAMSQYVLGLSLFYLVFVRPQGYFQKRNPILEDHINYFFDFRGVITRAGPMRPRMRATADAVVIEPEDVCKMPPVTPHERACLAFIPKWTFDFR